MQRRIVTRPDFDGVVCAVLLKEALGVETPVVWAQPNEVQAGKVPVTPVDIVANLPLRGRVALWFDHHVSNATDSNFEGIYAIAPSAAGLVHEYFKEVLNGRFETLVRQADRIDGAQLSLDEILHPERHPYVLLSMTIVIREPSDVTYCDTLVTLLRKMPIKQVMADPVVQRRCTAAAANNKEYEACLKKHTVMRDHVSITDLRGIMPVPDGNRFLVYPLFPGAVVNVKLFKEGSHTVVKLGHSIINRGCRVNLGQLLGRFGGGGHFGAGACRFDQHEAERRINDIISILIRNQP